MVDDYDNSDEIRNLNDGELRELVRTELQSRNAFDADDVDVQVNNGAVTVSGRVGTEEELRIIDHVLTDVIGLADVTNNLVVDELRRAVSPEAIDEHLVDENEHQGILLGDVPRPFSPEAEHLADVHPERSLDEGWAAKRVRNVPLGGLAQLDPHRNPWDLSGISATARRRKV